MVEDMDVKPVFAVALVACCMAFSFVVKVYTNQSNVMLFGTSKTSEIASNNPTALTDYFKNIKAESATSSRLKNGEELKTSAILVRLYTE